LRVQTRKEISRLHQQLGATMIYVTHDQVEAMTLGDRIVVMHQGRVQQIDTPLALYHNPLNRFVAGFIGSPAMNFIEGRLVSDGAPVFEGWDGALQVPLGAAGSALAAHAGGRLVLGVRPEDVRVRDASEDRASIESRERGAAGLTLDLIEPMGNELFVYAKRENDELVARIPPQPLPPPGDAVVVTFDTSKLHFFDAETEQRVPMEATG
jgi:multiple sugar transport system ATP-binding protein